MHFWDLVSSKKFSILRWTAATEHYPFLFTFSVSYTVLLYPVTSTAVHILRQLMPNYSYSINKNLIWLLCTTEKINKGDALLEFSSVKWDLN